MVGRCVVTAGRESVVSGGSLASLVTTGAERSGSALHNTLMESRSAASLGTAPVARSPTSCLARNTGRTQPHCTFHTALCGVNLHFTLPRAGPPPPTFNQRLRTNIIAIALKCPVKTSGNHKQETI
ncbi:hypothetical protein E2C01_053056 [Portunus trituberculatus]|uniref:Uncharacterized protein n=1 Tax=Portunus trituberculatus TaxID=210409 RepID=A0A5B7GG38_PORTR|nr:hypothetical protein [Portunus trituberculatus]